MKKSWQQNKIKIMFIIRTLYKKLIIQLSISHFHCAIYNNNISSIIFCLLIVHKLKYLTVGLMSNKCHAINVIIYSLNNGWCLQDK